MEVPFDLSSAGGVVETGTCLFAKTSDGLMLTCTASRSSLLFITRRGSKGGAVGRSSGPGGGEGNTEEETAVLGERQDGGDGRLSF